MIHPTYTNDNTANRDRLPACQLVVGKRKLTMNKLASFVLERVKVIVVEITSSLALHATFVTKFTTHMHYVHMLHGTITTSQADWQNNNNDDDDRFTALCLGLPG